MSHLKNKPDEDDKGEDEDDGGDEEDGKGEYEEYESEEEEEEESGGEDEDDKNEKDGGEEEEEKEDAEALEKPGTLKDNIVLIISSGSVCGLVTLIAIIGFLFVRRKKAKRQREFMENNPIYGDDYYYSPIKANDEKVEYYEVTINNVEKQDT